MLSTVPGIQLVPSECVVLSAACVRCRRPRSASLSARDGPRLSERFHLTEERCFAEGEPGSIPSPVTSADSVALEG